MQLLISGDNQLKSKFGAVVWVEIAAWLLSAYYYCLLINTGLKLYPPSFFIPVQAVFFALFTIICGGVFFDEFNFNTLQAIMFSVGCLLIFVGVWSLSPNHIDIEKSALSNTAKILAVNNDEFFDDINDKLSDHGENESETRSQKT